MPDHNITEDFDRIIARAIREGEDGRKALVRHLSTLSLADLSRVPPKALSLIGPDGLVAFARGRAEFAGIAPKEQRPGGGGSQKPAEPTVKVAGRLSTFWSWRPKVLTSSTSVCLLILVASIAFDPVRHRIDWMMAASVLPRDATRWPGCDRLDRWTDGCVYQTGSNTLSLSRAAGLLDMPVSDLADLNRHLRTGIDQPLVAGSKIVVLRDRSRLSGE